MTIIKVRKDEKGLFVWADGFKARPLGDIPFITKFNEGDKVSVTRPAGTTAYVKEKPGRDIEPELWRTFSETR